MREVRRALGLTQEQMARERKCSLSTVTRLERLSLIERLSLTPHNEAVKENFARLAREAGVQAD